MKKEQITEMKKFLNRGDMKKISELTGLKISAISRYVNGKTNNCPADTLINKIVQKNKQKFEKLNEFII